MRQGAVDGNAGDVAGGGSPNGGLLTTIAPLGVNGDGATSFDIAGPPGGGGTGWAAIRRVGEAASTLYAIDLSPGPVAARASAVGAIGAGPLAGMTVLRGGAIRAAAPPPAPEGAGQAVVRVERGGETLAPTSLAFRTSDRTAVAGRDYVAVSGTLDFAQGLRAVDVAIPLLQDAAGEPPEVLALELGAPTGGAVLDAPLVAVEIADDDGPAAADTTRPGYRQTPRRPRSLAALRRTPVMRVRVACTEACRLRLSLSLKSIRLGTARASLRAAGAAVVTAAALAGGPARADRAEPAGGARHAGAAGDGHRPGGQRHDPPPEPARAAPLTGQPSAAPSAAGSGSRSNWVSSRIVVRVRSTPTSSRRRTSRRSIAGGIADPDLQQQVARAGGRPAGLDLRHRAHRGDDRVEAPLGLDGHDAREAQADRAGADARAVAGDHAAPLELADAVVHRRAWTGFTSRPSAANEIRPSATRR